MTEAKGDELEREEQKYESRLTFLDKWLLVPTVSMVSRASSFVYIKGWRARAQNSQPVDLILRVILKDC